MCAIFVTVTPGTWSEEILLTPWQRLAGIQAVLPLSCIGGYNVKHSLEFLGGFSNQGKVTGVHRSSAVDVIWGPCSVDRVTITSAMPTASKGKTRTCYNAHSFDSFGMWLSVDDRITPVWSESLWVLRKSCTGNELERSSNGGRQHYKSACIFPDQNCMVRTSGLQLPNWQTQSPLPWPVNHQPTMTS